MRQRGFRVGQPHCTACQLIRVSSLGIFLRRLPVCVLNMRQVHDMYAGQRALYPVCFLTNGGGVTEQDKADQLASWLGVRVTAEHFCHDFLLGTPHVNRSCM